MKLRQREIEIISQNIANTLLNEGFIEADSKEDLIQNVGSVIHDDLVIEDELNEEVKKILDSHSSDIEKSQIEYYQLFNMVKSKLARERNLIL